MFNEFDAVMKNIIEKVKLKGCLHIGAHDCEEIEYYKNWGIILNDIVWIDAIDMKVNEARSRGIPNVYNAVITDKDNDDIVFNIANNVQSSSIFELGTHLVEHPYVNYVGKCHMKSKTIDTFMSENNLDRTKYNLWSFDIQGAELLALKGGKECLKYVDVIILEVNEKQLYKECCLVGEIDVFLSEYNFKRVHTLMTPHGWGDAIYILNKYI